jgi:N-acetylmuramoyl-L-alanine amidase
MVSQTLTPGPTLELRLPRTTTTPAALTPPVLTGPLLRGVTSQTTPDGTTIRFDLAGTQPWGYHAVWDGDDLVLRLRHVPNIDPARPLVGRRVVLDAGHGGTERGGMGALGTHEKDLVLPITLELARLLRERGAEVILTRETDVTVPLYDRPVLAEDLQSDLLVSVHANAIPDGVDPATRRGAGVYVSHPQARPLAADLLAALVADFPQIGQDREGIFQRSLALTRPSSQPSVLVELGYLTRPTELRLLMDAGARTRFAASLARGLETFLARQAQPSATSKGSGQATR